MKNGINIFFLTTINFSLQGHLRLFHILFYIFLLCSGCSKKNQTDIVTFKKMVSARNLGIAYLEEERYSDAAEKFKILIEIAPEEPNGYANLGLSYMRMSNRLKESEIWLKKAFEIFPKNPEIRLLLSEFYQLSDNDREAMNLLEQSILYSPNHRQTLYELALLHSKMQDSDSKVKAEKYMRRLAEALPSNLVVNFKLIELLLENHNYDEALYYLEIINQTLPELPRGAGELMKRILLSLKNEDKHSAFAPVMMLNNILRPTSIYKSSIQEIEGNNNPFSGQPIYKFLKTKTPEKNKTNTIPNYIKFADVSEQVGLNISNNSNEYKFNKSTFVLGDYDLDGDEDLFLSRWSSIKNISQRFLLNNEQGSYLESERKTGIEQTGQDIFALFIDYDDNGYLDLFVANAENNKLYKNLNTDEFNSVSLDLNTSSLISNGLFRDFDLEGDLDFLLLSNSGNYFFRNNSDSTFTELGAKTGLGGTAFNGKDLVSADFDDDGDIDVFIIGKNGDHKYFDNLRQGYFRNENDRIRINRRIVPGALVAADYNNDGYIDIFISDIRGEDHQLYQNNGRGFFQLNTDWKSKLKNSKKIAGYDASFFDYDNDGFMDILIAGKIKDTSKNSTGLHLYYNNRKGKFIKVTELIPEGLGEIEKVESSDFDNDGDLDLFIASTDGSLKLLRNDGGNINNHLKLQLKGLRTGSGKNNYFGIGSKIEVKAGDLYQTRYVDKPTNIFGLGNNDAADVVRILWTNGVPQNHFEPSANQTIVEEQFLKGSCPYLFGWDGSKFEFMTDVLWPSALGMPLGIMAGETLYAFPNSTDEYLMVPGKIQPKDGHYLMNFTTELWETPYLDKVHLLAIDHPDSVEVLIDEKFSPPPFPSSRIYNFTKKYLPIYAEDHRGNDVLEVIENHDKRYLSNFLMDKYQGVSELHDLILGFDNLDDNDSLFLFLQGWLFPTDASINVNISQSKTTNSIFPYIEVVGEDGDWIVAEENIGFPKGKNKTMVINMTNKFLSEDYRIRIRTTMQIYWDHIFITSNASGNIFKSYKLNPVSADLSYRGFSEINRVDFSSPHIPDYYNVNKGQKWRDLIGNYTRYGDVLPLLLESDNKYVIMNAGDEIKLKFDASSLPEIKKGWKRDFLFYNDGWLKDGDLNTAEGQTVDPLPFHGMNSYPYENKSDFPMDQFYKNYQKNYNSRVVTTDQFKNYLREQNK